MEWVWTRKNECMQKTKRETKKDEKRETKKDEKRETKKDDVYSIQNKVDFEINKKDEQNMKLQCREAIIQRSVNPFMTRDYSNDLEIQNNFLIPKDSNNNYNTNRNYV